MAGEAVERVRTKAERDRIKLEAALGRKSLYEFLRMAWNQVPDVKDPFVDGPHIELVCRHLEAVSRGLCNRLLINIPPGCSKSLICAVFWQVWDWLQDSTVKWQNISFDRDLTYEQGQRVSALIESDWFQERWGDRLSIRRMPKKLGVKSSRARTTQTKGIFYTSGGGSRMSTMVKGKATGWHCHKQVMDDPTKPQDVQEGGETARKALEKTRKTWGGTFSSRQADPKKFARVVVMQRLHFDDLSQNCIDEGYVHLCLPMEYDPKRHCKTPFGEDWRTEKGELLCPDRFDAAWVKQKKKEMTPRDYAAQYDQLPNAEGGSVFLAEWFERRWLILPANGVWTVTVDCSFKKLKDTDFVSIQLWYRAGPDHYLVHNLTERLGFWQTVAEVLKLFERFQLPLCDVWVEEAANGAAVVETLKALITGCDGVPPKGSKESRAHNSTIAFSHGNVYLPGAPEQAEMVNHYIQEFIRFPMGANDDQVDATSLYFLTQSPGTGFDQYLRMAEALKAQEQHT